MSFIDTVLAIAKEEEGQQEVPKGSNRGPKVTLYQNRSGYPGAGVPWCVCFCYWSIDEACRRMTVANVLKKTGSCDVLLAWAKEHDILHKDPVVGDIGLVLARPGSNDGVHAFFVMGVAGGRIKTMEGNSNDDGSREGYEVVARSRPISAKIVYVRWSDLPGFKGLSAKPKPPAANVADDPAPPASAKVAVVVSGTKLGDFDVMDGSTMAPVRELLEALTPGNQLGRVEKHLGWDGESRTVTLDDHVLPSQVLVRDGVTYAHVRKVVDFANEVFDTHWDLTFANSTITIA